MNKKDFDNHTSDKNKNRAFRTKYLNKISEVITKPDEVWLGRDNDAKKQNMELLNNWFMVKYYKETPLVVRCKIIEYEKRNEMKFVSWFELKDKSVRSGILIKKKVE